MKFSNPFKKKPVMIPVKKEEAKQEKKQYSVQEIEKIADEFYYEVIQKIGKGEFRVGFDIVGEKAEIYAILFLDMNNPVYNSLFRDLCWKYKPYEGISFDLRYEGLMVFCKQVAEEKNITVEITEWSAENIVIDFEKEDSTDLWGRHDYYMTNKKTLADYAREKCFAW